MTTETRINGVNVEQLTQTVEHIRNDPSLARFQFHTNTTWKGGARSETKIQRFYGAGQEDTSRSEPLKMAGDEPPVLLGDNTAPNAVEATLHALAACLTVGFVYNAAARGIEVRSLDFDIEGEMDLRGFLGLSEDVRPGYSTIQVRYKVDTNASGEDIEDLCRYTQETSPVMDMLRNPVSVNVDRVS
jgi:uncharacterized OsmC-like protein